MSFIYCTHYRIGFAPFICRVVYLRCAVVFADIVFSGPYLVNATQCCLAVYRMPEIDTCIIFAYFIYTVRRLRCIFLYITVGYAKYCIGINVFLLLV